MNLPTPGANPLLQSPPFGELLCKYAADFVSVVDCSGRRVYSNLAHQRTFSGASEDADFSEVHPEDRAILKKAIAETSASGSNQRAEVRLVPREGKVLYVECVTSSIPDDTGKARNILIIARDVTERRSGMAHLRRSEALYESLVENLPQNIFRKDLVGRYTFANRRFCQTVKRPLDQILAKTDYDFFPPEFARNFQEEDRIVVRTSNVLETMEEIQIAGGEKRIMHVMKIPIYDTQRHIIGIQGVFWDISEQARSEGALQHTFSHLKKSHDELNAVQLKLIQAAKLEAVGTLAVGIVHEVKNPLQAILTGLDVLSQRVEASSPEVNATLEDMRKAVRRAYNTISALLEFTAASHAESKEEDLNAILAEALLLMYYELSRGKVRLIGDLCPDLPSVRLDKNKIKQVFINLILNAVQAMPEGGTLIVRTGLKQVSAQNSAKPSSKRSQTCAWVEFQDSGTGISPADLNRIFEPLFTTKPPGTGSGLGLKISKKIIEMHGGAIQLSNVQTGGVLATITLKI